MYYILHGCCGIDSWFSFFISIEWGECLQVCLFLNYCLQKVILRWEDQVAGVFFYLFALMSMPGGLPGSCCLCRAGALTSFSFFAFSFFWSSNDQCVRSTCTPKPSIPSASFHISSLYLCFQFVLSWEIVCTIAMLILSCLCKYSLKLKIVHKFTLKNLYF